MDLSIIPEIIIDTFEGAAKASAGINKIFSKPANFAVQKAVEKKAGPVGGFVQTKRKGWDNDSMTEKVGDVLDLASFIPVAGAGASALKGVVTTGKIVRVASQANRAKILANSAKAAYKEEMKAGANRYAKDSSSFLKKAKNAAEKNAKEFGGDNLDRYLDVLEQLESADRKYLKSRRKGQAKKIRQALRETKEWATPRAREKYGHQEPKLFGREPNEIFKKPRARKSDEDFMKWTLYEREKASIPDILKSSKNLRKYALQTARHREAANKRNKMIVDELKYQAKHQTTKGKLMAEPYVYDRTKKRREKN